MGLKRDYTKSTVGKLDGGPGGWKCRCCNPFNCHPRNMKALARRRVRRVGRVELQAALLVEAEVDRAAEEAYAMDRYYRELGDELRQDSWREMDVYEAETGMRFVNEAHFDQHMAYEDFLERMENWS